MMKLFVSLFSLSLFFINAAYAAPAELVIEGNLFDSSDAPVEDPTVLFTLQVLSPGVEGCLLYEETQTISMANSGGYFKLNLGNGISGSGHYAQLSSALDNTAASISPATCDSPAAYDAAPADGRKLRLTYQVGAGSPQTLAQDIDIRSTAFALSAASVGGLQAADILPLAGGTMTGALDMGANAVTSSFTPAGANDLTNKTYVDSEIATQIAAIPGDGNKLDIAGGTMTGALDMGANAVTSSFTPAGANDLTNKTYVDSEIATQIAAIPGDGNKLDIAGGTMTGALDMGANAVTSSFTPAGANDLTNKTYVDSEIATQIAAIPGDGNKLDIAGGTMTGALDMGANNISSSGTIAGANLSASNDLNVTNNATIGGTLSVTGGLGVNGINSGADIRAINQNEIQLGDADDSAAVRLRSPATLAADVVLTLPTDDGNNLDVLQTDGVGNLSWVSIPSAPITAATNVGGGGVGPYKQLNANTLEFKNINAASTKVSVTDDTGNNEIDIDINEANIDHDSLMGFVPNEHIDHSAVLIGTAANSGLTGGGDLTATRNLSIDIAGTADVAAAQGADTLLIRDDDDAGNLKEISRANFLNGYLQAIIGTSSGDVMGADAVPNCTAAQKLQMSAGPVFTWSCVNEQALGVGSVGSAEIANSTVALEDLNATGATVGYVLTATSGTTMAWQAPAGGGDVFNGGQAGALTLQSTDNSTTVNSNANTTVDSTLSTYILGGNDVYIRSDAAGGNGDIIFQEGAAPVEIARITETGKFGLGTSTPLYDMEISKDGSSEFGLTSASAGVNTAKFIGRRARGSIAAPADVQMGDTITEIMAQGYNGTSGYMPSAKIRMVASENHTTSGQQGAHMSFYTAENGMGGPQERMRIDHDGNIGIGTNFPSSELDVGGFIKSKGLLVEENSANTSVTIKNESSAGSPILRGEKSSLGGATNVSEKLLSIEGVGHDGAAFHTSPNVEIRFLANENQSASNRGSKIEFATTPNSSSTLTTAMEIQGNGNVNVTNGNFIVNGDVSVTGRITGVVHALAMGESAGTMDFSQTNMGFTAASCGTFYLHNLHDGGTYYFNVQGTTSALCALNVYSDAGTTALNVRYKSGSGVATIASEQTLFTIRVFGTTALISQDSYAP